MNEPRILVAGAGALGSVFGGFLRRAGHDVTLLGRQGHLEAIDREGLIVHGIWGDHRINGFRLAVSVSDLRGPFDLILVTVKSYDVEEIAGRLAGCLAEGGAVLSIQNGLGSLDSLGRAFGRDRVLGAPVLIGGEITAPGRVRITVYAKPVKVGSPARAPDALRVSHRWAELLSAAGIPSEPTDRLFAYLWEKVLYNAPLNSLGALLRVPYGSLAEDAESRRIMDEVIGEAFSVARAECADLLWDSAEACRRHFYETLLPPTAHHRSSMLQDLDRGRRTEIDSINGYIARRGEALGVATPVNALLTRLVHFAERRGARAAEVG